ncbi:MAG TPA: ferrochelatase, partial [Vicinamibacterales bacterium]
EVLYDLDMEAAAVAKALGMTLARASAVNAHPRFLETMAETVIERVDRYRGGRPLQIVAAS